MGDYRHNPPYMEDINTHLLFTVAMRASRPYREVIVSASAR